MSWRSPLLQPHPALSQAEHVLSVNLHLLPDDQVQFSSDPLSLNAGPLSGLKQLSRSKAGLLIGATFLPPRWPVVWLSFSGRCCYPHQSLGIGATTGYGDRLRQKEGEVCEVGNRAACYMCWGRWVLEIFVLGG